MYTLAKSATACPQKGQGTPPATALSTLSAAVSPPPLLLEAEDEEKGAAAASDEGGRRLRPR